MAVQDLCKKQACGDLFAGLNGWKMKSTERRCAGPRRHMV
jgi:hypothetical protein